MEKHAQRDRLPLAHADVQRLYWPALHRRSRRRGGAANPGATRRLCLVFARRHEDGLQPRVSGIPHVEALRRRHGRRHLGLRFQDRCHRERLQQSRAGHHPDVGAERKNLLPLGARRALQSILLRHRHEENRAAHDVQGLRHQVPVARQGRYHVRAGRLPLALRPEDREGPPSAHRGEGGRRRLARGRRERVEIHDRSRPLARRQARGGRGARRNFHCARQERPGPQPHQHARRARARCRVVARRQVDRLHL